jgi:MFS family permease
LLLAALLGILAWSGSVQPWHILLTTFGGALLLAFDNPTRQALIPDLVPREDLLNALSLNSATFTGAALVGPTLAGVLLDVIGAGWLFMLNAFSFLAVIGALRAMRELPVRPNRPAPLRHALFGGFIYAWQHRLILFLLVLSGLAAVFGRSYQQLLPVFADDIWHVGSSGYGTLLAAGGAGALIGAFAIASIRTIERLGRVLVISGLVFCGALAAFVLSRLFLLGVVLLVIVGIAATVFSTMIATMIQLRVPGALRGRVMSLYAITLIGLPSLGALGIAALAGALGDQARSAWSGPLLQMLDVLGVNAFTHQLGAAAGAPRAITLGALALVLALALTAPVFLRSEGVAIKG